MMRLLWLQRVSLSAPQTAGKLESIFHEISQFTVINQDIPDGDHPPTHADGPP